MERHRRLQGFTRPWQRKGMRPSMARLTPEPEIAAIT